MSDICVIPYSPRPLQWRFHEERTRFCVLLCHRRFGKTVAAVNDLLRQALRSGRDDWRGAYMAPYLGQAKAVAWDYLKRFAGAVPGTRFHEGELRCDLPTGARLRLFGTDNADALRGLYLDDLVLDEPADMPREVWTRVLRPMLADRRGRALFCGTPHGTDNLLYDMWEEAGREIARTAARQEGGSPAGEQAGNHVSRRSDSECPAGRGAERHPVDMWEEAGREIARTAARQAGGSPNKSEIKPHPAANTEFSRFRFPASMTGYIDADELQAARSHMNAEDYAQEFECSFAAAVRGAYFAAAVEELEARGRVAAVPPAPELPVHTAWDLGMDDATGIWFFQVEPGGQWRMLEYYENSGEGLAHYVRHLQSRSYVYGRHIAPHDIRVRELGTGVSRLETAASLGIRFDVAPPLPLADGIHALRQMLPRMWFDARGCAAGLRALRNYRRQWRPRQEVFATRPLHDWTSHCADALRYAVTGFRPEAESPGVRQARTQYNMWGRQ